MNMLEEITILLLAAVLAAPFGKISRIGSVLAFAAVGVLIGPWGLGLISDSEDILHFAEIGVVFLLFLIGLELQPKRLWALRKLIFGAGFLQLASTTVVLCALLLLAGFKWQSALIISYGLSLSSTAFALRLLADNNELQAEQGRMAFGILLLQDLAVIPFLAIIPLLATADSSGSALAAAQLDPWLALLIFVTFVVAGRYLLLPFLRLIAWTRVNEAFTCTALLLVLGSALLMESIGLSMGLGAFIAGVLVADSEYRHQLEADIEPFKALLLGLFFMAVGMSTNIGILADAALQIAGGVVLLVGSKSLLLYGVGRFTSLQHGKSLRLAAYLCQGGEFGFVVFTLASSFSIISADLKDQLILIITLSMALTPLLLKAVGLLAKPAAADKAELAALELNHNEESRIIIAGFGRFGQILGRVLNARGLHYTAIDINPEQVKLVRQFGNKVYYGDVSRHSLLETAHADKAAIFALCIDDIQHSIAIVHLLKKHYPQLKIFARARNRMHEIRLRELQVHYVIRETLLSSLEFTRQVLQGTGLSEEEAQQVVHTFRAQDRRLIEQQAAIIDDSKSMIQSAQQAAAELKLLLQNESRITPAPVKPREAGMETPD